MIKSVMISNSKKIGLTRSKKQTGTDGQPSIPVGLKSAETFQGQGLQISYKRP